MIVAVIALASMCVYLGILLTVERGRAIRRENDLLNRIMTRDYSEYAAHEHSKDLAAKIKPVVGVEEGESLDYRTLPVS